MAVVGPFFFVARTSLHSPKSKTLSKTEIATFPTGWPPSHFTHKVQYAPNDRFSHQWTERNKPA
jgi:hypothetical protein